MPHIGIARADGDGLFNTTPLGGRTGADQRDTPGDHASAGLRSTMSRRYLSVKRMS